MQRKLATPKIFFRMIPKTKRFDRGRWSPLQLKLLRSVYVHTQMPSAEDISSLAYLLDVSVKRVRIWFQNQRQRKEFVATYEDQINAILLIL